MLKSKGLPRVRRGFKIAQQQQQVSFGEKHKHRVQLKLQTNGE